MGDHPKLGRRGRGGRPDLGLDGETKMNTTVEHETKEPNVAASFSDLTHDVIELTELQGQAVYAGCQEHVAEDANCRSS